MWYDKPLYYKILFQIISLEDNGKDIDGDLEKLEKQIYYCQLQIYETHMEVLNEEEKLVKKQIQFISEKQDGIKSCYMYSNALHKSVLVMGTAELFCIMNILCANAIFITYCWLSRKMTYRCCF